MSFQFLKRLIAPYLLARGNLYGIEAFLGIESSYLIQGQG
jgi:hypothetical protein